MSHPLKVFLSHAHADADAVRTLYDRLVADGVDAWLDKEKLIPGQDWEREIRKAVREADVVIVCLSQQFNQRGYRQKEVRIALDEAEMIPEGEIFIIPARLEECENLESLRKWHWVDLYEKDGYKRLLRSLQFRAKNVNAGLKPKKNPISGVFRKPVIQRQGNIKSIKSDKPKHKKTPAKEKNTFFEKFKALVKERVQILVISILIIAFAYFVSFIVPSWISKAKSSLQATPIQTKDVVPTSTEKAVVESSITLAPIKTVSPSLTPTIIYTPSPTSFPEEISDIDPAGNEIPMRFVPAGEFMMGSDKNIIQSDLMPAHEVYLDAYYMDVYEVTNAAYKLCISDGNCERPQDAGKYTNEKYAQHPVVGVNWHMANTYCEWRDARLPTEAEWEKAARGTDGRTYPWGEGLDYSKANNNYDYVGNTTVVGSYESGKSPYGMYDMEGNVSEWVADWYDREYYTKSPESNPEGPENGTRRVLRGGAWRGSAYFGSDEPVYGRDATDPLDVGHRIKQDGEYIYLYTYGFRCAKDAP